MSGAFTNHLGQRRRHLLVCAQYLVNSAQLIHYAALLWFP